MNKGQQRQHNAYLDGKKYALAGYPLRVSKYWGCSVRGAFRKRWHEVAEQNRIGERPYG